MRLAFNEVCRWGGAKNLDLRLITNARETRFSRVRIEIMDLCLFRDALLLKMTDACGSTSLPHSLFYPQTISLICTLSIRLSDSTSKWIRITWACQFHENDPLKTVIEHPLPDHLKWSCSFTAFLVTLSERYIYCCKSRLRFLQYCAVHVIRCG